MGTPEYAELSAEVERLKVIRSEKEVLFKATIPEGIRFNAP